MAPLKKNLKSIIILAVLVIICAVILTVSFKDSEVFRKTRQNLSDFFMPVQEKTFSFFQPAIGFFRSLKDYTALAGKIEELEKEKAILEEKYSENINLKIENDALRDLAGLEVRKDHETAVAKVIGYSENTWQSEIVLNTGRKDGVLEDMAVVDQDGLIGTVIFSSDDSCRVRLLHDPNTSIGARVLSSRNLGIIAGSHDGKVFLDYYPDDELIFKGDTIITSEYSDLVPPEILIGRVRSVSESSEQVYRIIEIDPFADFSSLEYVLIIKN